MSEELIYALDVGTRKVMGVVARRLGRGVEVLACDVAEHATRAMGDGEVRDVLAVAEIVGDLTRRLSEKVGAPLRRAAVAVAGRDLRTSRGRAGLDLPQPGPVEPEHVRRAVLDAVQDALARLPRTADGAALSSHYCVGYAATRVLVDGDELPDPLGHHASRLEIEVLATTLPRRVLDGLAAALERAGLEPSTITLEPIAALQAAVPEDVRRFHLALVDVGAGTSDIAIVREGQIQAFGMVPCAGDFVTESLADLHALDFFAAERAKRELSAGRAVEVPDIFDRPRTMTPAEQLPELSAAGRELAARVAEAIMALGAGSPRLALCVGGGSLTPGFQEALAEALGLAPERVGCRRVGAEGLPAASAGPQAATPLGIALVAAADRGLRLRRFRLDGRPLFALEVGGPLTVLDALTSAGVNPADICGRLGLSTTYTLNGELRTARGTRGRPARVECEGLALSLDDAIPEQASLSFVPAERGADARQTLGRALAEAGLERRIRVLGRPVTIHPRATVNGSPADPDAPLPDRARVEWREWPTLGEMLGLLGIENENGFLVDGRPADLDGIPADGALVEPSPEPIECRTPAPSPRAEAPSVPAATSATARACLAIRVNGERVELDRPAAGSVAADAPALLVDILPRLGGGLRPAAGRRLRMTIDGRPAGYTTPLHEGAEVSIQFD